MSDTEQWRPVVGAIDGYEVSSAGRVRSWFKRGGRQGERAEAPILMAGGLNSSGYRIVQMRNAADGRKSTRRVHQMVLEAFVGPKPPGFVCRHLDGDKANNDLGNLAWGTRADNEADRRRMDEYPRGTRSGTSKLTAADAVAIRVLSERGIGLGWLAKLFGVDRATISRCRDGKSWGHVEVVEAHLVAALEAAKDVGDG